MTVLEPDSISGDQILEDIKCRLVAAYKPKRIYLFGSKARGNPRADSDYDILVIVDDNVKDEFKSATLAYNVLWGVRAPVDVLILTDLEFQKRLTVPNTLSAEVAREGLLIHVA